MQSILCGVLLAENTKAQTSAYKAAPAVMEDIEVSGQVTDETGETLPGVNVVVKGANRGTVTDVDGNYRL